MVEGHKRGQWEGMGAINGGEGGGVRKIAVRGGGGGCIDATINQTKQKS